MLTKSHPYYFMWQSISHIMFIISEKKMKKLCIIGNTVWFQAICQLASFFLDYFNVGLGNLRQCENGVRGTAKENCVRKSPAKTTI